MYRVDICQVGASISVMQTHVVQLHFYCWCAHANSASLCLGNGSEAAARAGTFRGGGSYRGSTAYRRGKTSYNTGYRRWERGDGQERSTVHWLKREKVSTISFIKVTITKRCDKLLCSDKHHLCFINCDQKAGSWHWHNNDVTS